MTNLLVKTFSGKTILFYKEDITINSTWYDLKLLIEKKNGVKSYTKYYLYSQGKRKYDNDRMFSTNEIPNEDIYIQMLMYNS